jgi:hypothetical protein
MKAYSALALFFAVPVALAESNIHLCKDEQGKRYYDNSPQAGKGCKTLHLDVISVIPPSTRKHRLPISVGMSSDQVMHNWGKPAQVTRTLSRGGVAEQWVYPGGTLTFANGVLEMIQN